jgi:hypothetical protein
MFIIIGDYSFGDVVNLFAIIQLPQVYPGFSAKDSCNMQGYRRRK